MTKTYTGVIFTTTNEEARKISSDFDKMSNDTKQKIARLFDENSNIIGTIKNIYFTKGKIDKNCFTIDFTLSDSPQKIYIEKLIQFGTLKCSVMELNSGTRFFLQLRDSIINPIYTIIEKPEIEKLAPISAELQEFIDSFNNSLMYDTKKRLEDIEIRQYPLLKEAFDLKLVQFNPAKRIIITEQGRKYFTVKEDIFREDVVKNKMEEDFDAVMEDVIVKVKLSTRDQRQLVQLYKLVRENIDRNYQIDDKGVMYYLGKDGEFYQLPEFNGSYFVDNYEYKVVDLITAVKFYKEYYYGTSITEQVK